MGLFDRKKTTYYDSQPYYTLGNEKTMLIVGLGNPGKEHAAQRHNIGFMAVDRFHEAHDFSNWTMKKDLQAMESSGQIASTKIILIKPTTFMNNSGEAVQKIQKFYRIYNGDTIVIYDDIDVNFGTIRTRIGGGSAGHNGIKSLSQHIGEDYGRVRVGIGPKTHEKMDSADFVLQDFNVKEQEAIPKILKEVASLLDEATASGLPEHTINLS